MKKTVMSIFLILGTAYLVFSINMNDPKYLLGVLGVYQFTYIDPVIELTAQVCFWQLPILVALFFTAKSLKKQGANISRTIGWSILSSGVIFIVLALFSNISNYIAETISIEIFIIAALLILVFGKNKSKITDNNEASAQAIASANITKEKLNISLEETTVPEEVKTDIKKQLASPVKAPLDTDNGLEELKKENDTNTRYSLAQINVDTQEALQRILEMHKKFIFRENGGVPAILIDADLPNANLEQAFLPMAIIHDANFSHSNLCNANLQRADLSGSNLSNSNLEGTDLRNAYLPDLDLRYADCRDADLQDTTLDGAKLRGTNLKGAVLSGACLAFADLRGALLEGALYDDHTLWPIDFDPTSTGAIHVE